MVVPLDGIRAIHNAFRKDIRAIDDAAKDAVRTKGNTEHVLKRYIFLNDILVWHADGEEDYVFPAVEKVAPLVAESYQRDHRGLDTLFESLDKAVNSPEVIDIARTASAFRFFLNFHLDKEEAHLYRIFNERVSLPDQASIIGKMSQKIPQQRFPEAVTWLFPLLEIDDRENMTRMWKQALPEPAFTMVKGLIRSAIGNEWIELAQRIPELA